MSNRNWSRVGAASGFGFVLLLVLGYILGANDPPAFGSGAVASFVTENKNEIDTAAALILGALVFFAFFIGAIAAANRAADRDGRLSAAGHAGGIAALSAAVVGVALTASASAAVGAGNGDAIVEALSNTGALVFAAAGIGTGVLLYATGVIAVRFGANLPSWWGWVSILAGIFLAAVAIISMTTRSGAFNPYDGELAVISLLVLAIWSLGTATLLYQRAK